MLRQRFTPTSCGLVTWFAVFTAGCLSDPTPPTEAAPTPPEVEEAPPSEPTEPTQVAPPTIPPETPQEPPSERPEPKSTIRDCGVSNTTPVAVDAVMVVPSFYKIPIGAFVIPGTLVSSSVWATGEAKRFSPAVTARSFATFDLSGAEFLSALMIPPSTPVSPASSSPGEYSNLAHRSDQGGFGTLDASSGILTYAEGFGQQEQDWSIAAPRRTAKTGSVGTALFARGLVAGRFFGFQLALLMPTDCALGALSDAQKRKALLTDATLAMGIFDPSTMSDVQGVLLENKAKLFVRVLSNKPSSAVSNLLASTTCSTANLAGCKKLVDDLRALSSPSSAAPSDLAKLQAGNDPAWTTVEYVASPVSILDP